MTDFEAKAREIAVYTTMPPFTEPGQDVIDKVLEALLEAAQSGAEEMRERAGDKLKSLRGTNRTLEENHALAEAYEAIRALPLPMNKTPQDA